MVKNNFKSIRTLQLILFFLIIHLSASGGFLTANATVRYVSHSGSNLPPYTTWETAADSIMNAINISVFGDTIYVANGVYEEQVIMIPGLTLIGAGMDSCVIDTRDLATPTDFKAVEMKDSCTIEGFYIIVSNDDDGSGIHIRNGDIVVHQNKITKSTFCIYLYNSNAIITKNHLLVGGGGSRGIQLSALTNSYMPIVENNLFVLNDSGFGVLVTLGTKPVIRGNLFYLNHSFARGYNGGGSDTSKVYNNLIISEEGRSGINCTAVPTYCINNFLIGNFNWRGINAASMNVIKNNVVMNSETGIIQDASDTPIIQNNNSWNNEINYGGFTSDSTNISVDPMIVNDDTTQGELDFYLQMFSPLIDAGDPNILDVDGSRSDIGLYGGPFGESYTYQDLAPKPPRYLSAVVDSEYISLSWNKNTEADFRSYKLFRDTTVNFVADSATLVSNLTDTFYIQIIPPGIDAMYYKLTAADNQGNESGPSEELAVMITSVNEYPTTVSNYQLYQNYPNPFNPSTKIGYKLKERGYVKLMVYDIRGELVSLLVNQIQDAGYYEVEFMGERQEASGESLAQRLASGIYIYQIMIKSENNIPIYTDMKKMILLK